jgi:hypothetical protein
MYSLPIDRRLKRDTSHTDGDLTLLYEIRPLFISVRIHICLVFRLVSKHDNVASGTQDAKGICG